MDADGIVRNFQKFLNFSWSVVEAALASNEDPLDFQEAANDWMQANWEFLVESVLCREPQEFLEVYGDGADCNDGSSRIWLPDAVPTHRIVCRGKKENKVVNRLTQSKIRPEEFQFEGFVFWKDKRYASGPPFDHVLLRFGEDKAIVPLEDVRFCLEPVL